jgi:uncharacterized protein
MKVLAAGDIHSDVSLSNKLAERAKKEDVDLIILCGDLTNFDTWQDNLMKPFAKLNKKVLFVPGNHDSFATADFVTEIYGFKNIHGYSVKYEDVGIFGCGGANIGISALEEDEIMGLLEKSHDKIKYLQKKIMVTHVHPSETKMENFSKLVPGSDGVKTAIEKFKPDFLLCSHVHEAEGIEEKVGNTKVLNVGKEGKIFDI